jgi:hypothetical protein
MGATTRVAYDVESRMLRFSAADGATGASVAVRPHPETPEDHDYAYDVNARSMIELLRLMRCKEAELRLSRAVDSSGSGIATFSTVDEYWLDRHGKTIGGPGPTHNRTEETLRCRVTRCCAAVPAVDA